jgi:hypothetical protein
MQYIYIALGALNIGALGYAFYLGTKYAKYKLQNINLQASKNSVNIAKQVNEGIDKLSDADVHNQLNEWVHPGE